jgi:hypothetical protein
VKFIRWLATIVEDQAGSISSKRIGLFWCLYILHRAVEQPVVNDVVIYTIAVLSFGFAGLTVPEWFSNLKKQKNIQDNTATGS